MDSFDAATGLLISFSLVKLYSAILPQHSQWEKDEVTMK